MVFSKFDEDGLPRWKGKNLKIEKNMINKPFQSFFWAAGNSFSAGSLVRNCPYEESIGDIFFGEELLMMKFFFNKGYQLYHPTKNFIYHMWSRKYRATYREDLLKKDKEEETHKRSDL